MKIGIITIHYGVNHGSALQSFALNKFLNSNGINARTINYIPKRYRIWNKLYETKKRKYPKIIIIMYYPIYALKAFKLRKIFDKFLKKNLLLTKRVTNKKDLKSLSNSFDKIIVGSDQVWNDDYNGEDKNTYFLDFVNDNVEKNAYAASFGNESIESAKRKKEIKELLSNYKYITVRENNALNILRDIDINNALHVVDPTFLLSKNEWLEYSKKNSNLKINNKYILVYVMDGIYENLLQNASIIAKEMNLPIYVVCFKKIKDKRINKCFTKLAPFDFINIVANSSYIITNSFHGTAFSIIMRKQFLVIGKKKYNSRMKSLLAKTKLEDRFLQYNEQLNGNNCKKYLEKNDLDLYEEGLNEWIINSKKELFNMCGEKNDRYNR